MRESVSKLFVLATLLAAATGHAQPPKESRAETSDAAKKPPAIDPEAIAALKKMGAFLREQRSFSVKTTAETDHVLDTGQKVTVSTRGDLIVRRPDHVKLNVVSELKERQFFYDGETFTIFSPRNGFYAVLDAPPTIVQLADLLEDRYGLELPLVDLFRWGTEEESLKSITNATFIGTTKLDDGVEADHYAFRQPGIDWQIWIEHGDRPLPHKLVVTTTDDKARPEHAVEMAWDLAARHDDAAFVFEPPEDSTKIAMGELSTFRPDEPRRARRSPAP